MKYEIYIYDTSIPVGSKKLLYSTESPTEDTNLVSPTLTLKENASGSLTFTIPVTNSLYGQIRPMAQTVLVSKDDSDNYIWAGRVVNMEEDMYGSQQMYCEGALSFLNDTIQPPSQYNGPLIGFFNQLLNVHNAKVTGDRKIYSGVVDIPEKNTNITRYTNYENTWKCLTTKLLETYGGYMTIRMQGSKFYLDWIADSPHTCSQDIVFGENLVDYTRNYEWDDFATVVIPTGAMLDESPIPALYAYTDVSSVNNGSIYVESPEAISVYGRIEKAVEWGDITDPATLLQKGRDYLSQQQFDKMEISLTALDQHMIDAGIESFDILDRVEVISPPHGLNKFFVISQITIPFDAPEETEFILGKGSGTTLSEAISTGMLAVNSKIGGLPTAQQVTDISNQYANGVANSAKNEAIDASNQHANNVANTAKNEAINTSNQHANTVANNAKNEAIQASGKYANQVSNQAKTEAINTSKGYTDSQIQQAAVSILQQAQENATNLINAQGFEGYVTLKKNSNNVIEELLITNDPDYRKATKVWRWNLNGLGYSNKGYNGPYTTAWTIDGQFVADFITAGTMSASRIKGGTLLLGEGVGDGSLTVYGENPWLGSGSVIPILYLNENGISSVGPLKFITATGTVEGSINTEKFHSKFSNVSIVDPVGDYPSDVQYGVWGITLGKSYANSNQLPKFALLETSKGAKDLFVYNGWSTVDNMAFIMYGGLTITKGGLNIPNNSLAVKKVNTNDLWVYFADTAQPFFAVEGNSAVKAITVKDVNNNAKIVYTAKSNELGISTLTSIRESLFFYLRTGGQIGYWDAGTGQLHMQRHVWADNPGHLYSYEHCVAYYNATQALLSATSTGNLRIQIYNDTDKKTVKGYEFVYDLAKKNAWYETPHLFHNGGMAVSGNIVSMGRFYLNKGSNSKSALIIEIDESATITHFRSRKSDDSGWQTSMWIKHSGSYLAGWPADITFCVPVGIAYIGNQLEVRYQLSILCKDQTNTDVWAVRMEAATYNSKPGLWFIGGTPQHDWGSKNCTVIIEGSLVVTGTKNRVIETENYGSRLMNAEETPEARFNDYGSDVVGTDGTVEIFIDPIFCESIELSMSYQVFLTRTSEKKTEWVEKKETSFVVYGEPGASFDWMISAIQKDYAGVRFEETTGYKYQEAEVVHDGTTGES